MKSPKNGAGSGGAIGSLAQTRPQVDHPALSRHHLLTDGHGRYAALLCRDSGSLIRLGKVARA
jgi:hypothetical protein